MASPLLLAVDADPVALRDIELELRGRYASSYRVVCTASPDEALALLAELSDAGEEVALVLAAQWLSETTGGELLERVRQLHPHAKRGLLVPWRAWAHRPTTEAILDSMTVGRIDYYVLKPAAAPDELFHQAVSSFLLEWTKARRIAPHTTRVVAEDWSGRAYELRAALQRCAIPHAFHLSDSTEGRALLGKAGPKAKLPVMALPDGQVLSDPTNMELAEATGTSVEPERDDFDVVIVGAGPAGLSAAVYGASEGLSTLVVDEGGIGGQATFSSLIRNYLGFPRGVSGSRLAEQAYVQALGLRCGLRLHAEGDRYRSRGRAAVRDSLRRPAHRRPGRDPRHRRQLPPAGVPALEALNGAGVFYGGPASEAHAMAGKDAYVVGGANSAGQAALHLARHARRVTLVVRAQSLAAGMSHYLVQELQAARNVEVRTGTEVVGGGGDGRLRQLVLRRAATGEHETVGADGLFVLIGARPRTDWLPARVAPDRRGFLITGADLSDHHGWPLERRPLLLETSMPGLFAVGDARHGSVKRVASAVGEGSIAIQLVHGLFETAPPASAGASAADEGQLRVDDEARI